MDFTPDTWAAVSALLDQALEHDVSAQAEWLQRISALHPELAPQLRCLLAAHATSETADVLARLPAFGAAAHSAAHVAGLAPGDLVGPYRLSRQIGSGGMAEVWLARRADGAFERNVALKLPRLTLLRDDLAMRFRHERDILARLEHPHIARFYDAGVTPDGLPYLAMEYIEGLPILAWCDQRQLEISARLALFVQVLDAVQFAHASLVIHRDLKPSNILVTEQRQAQLLDFGIAKLLADGELGGQTRLTQYAGRVLTPDYASPEQVRGEPLTIASDVYSLGVVLYELLIGERPYRLKLQSVAQLEEAILSVDPVRPSRAVTAGGAHARGVSAGRLSRMLRGDLDTVVLKALAKHPAERYATVADFAEDLQRHLTGSTVRARPAAWSYTARKFIARNRFAVGAATVAGMALVCASAVSLWQAHVARQQAARAQQQALRAEQITDFLTSLFEGADVDNGGRRQATALDLLHKARDRLKTAPIADDATSIELLGKIGWALEGLGEPQGPDSLLAAAARRASSTSSDNDHLAAVVLDHYGAALLRQGELAAAAPQLAEAERRTRRAGDWTTLFGTLDDEADLLSRQGSFDEAIRLDQEVITLSDRQATAIDRDDRLLQLAGANSSLAEYAHESYRAGGLEYAQRAMKLAGELFGDHDTPFAAALRCDYGVALADAGEAMGGLAQLQQARRLQSEVFGLNHGRVAGTDRDIAEVHLMLGDPASAIESMQDALRIADANGGGQPTSMLAAAKLAYASVLANARRDPEALVEGRAADAAYSSLYGVDSERARLARSSMGLALTRLGELEQAQAIFDSLRTHPFRSKREEAFFNDRLGLLRSAQGRHSEGLQLLRDAVGFFEAAPSAWTRALALEDLGNGLLAAGEAQEALTTLQRARTLLLSIQHNGSPDLADIYVDISRSALALGNPAEALGVTQEAAAFWLRFDPSNRHTGLALLWQARALAATGDTDKSAAVLRRATAVLATSVVASDRALLFDTRRALSTGHHPLVSAADSR
jgi:serine/threonine-protein kinase